MGERKTKVQLGDRTVDGFEVPVDSSSEKWSEFILEDGTIIRAKVSIISAIRMEGEYDAAGNPAYQVNAANVIGVIHTNDELKKKS
jgi:hypothetical protein